MLAGKWFEKIEAYPNGSGEIFSSHLPPTDYGRSALLISDFGFKDATFGELAKTSVTPMIDFDLNTERGTGSPDASAGVPEQNFSVRWTGVVQPLMDGAYTFYVDGDNDVRLYIDGKRIIKKTSKGREEESKKVRLHGGRAVEVKVEYVHANGAPSLHVLWSGPQMEKQVLMPVKP